MLVLIEIAAGLHEGAGEGLCSGAEDEIADVAVLFGDGCEVLPAQAKVQSEKGIHTPIVLSVAGVDVGTDVFCRRGWGSGSGIEGSVFEPGFVVGELPQIAEGVGGDSGVGLRVVVELFVAVKAKADVVRARGLGEGVADVVGGLSEVTGAGCAEVLEVG